MEATEPDAVVDAGTSSVSSSRRGRKKAKRTTASTEQSLDERLARLGEAFMSSIEEPEMPRRRVRAAVQPASASSVGIEPTAKPSRRRRKRGRKSPVSSSTADPAAAVAPKKLPAQPEVGPAGPAKSGGGPPRGEAEPVPQRRITAAEKRRFMSGKVSEIRGPKAPEPVQKRRKEPQDPEDDPEFNKTLRQVLDYVTPLLGKRERMQYEDAKLRALGATVEKRDKCGYKLLQRTVKKEEEAARAAREQEKVDGVITGKSRSTIAIDRAIRAKKTSLKEKKRRQAGGALLSLGMGAREKRGLVTISQKSIRELRSKRRGR